MSKKELAAFFLLLVLLSACGDSRKPPSESIAATPEELDQKVTDLIHTSLEFAASNNGNIDDSISLAYLEPVRLIYGKNQYAAIWSGKERWNAMGDSLLDMISKAQLYGLFPEDYHFPALDRIRVNFLNDSLARGARMDAVIWSKADMLLTDAFVHVVKDIKLGRLPQDSITLRKDSVLTNDFFLDKLKLLQADHHLSGILQSLEPRQPGYRQVKAGIPEFLAHADYRVYTIVPFPKENRSDFKTKIQSRLYEGGYIAYDSTLADSAALAESIKKFQADHNITVDGKAGEETVRLMNITDRERFIRIAITLDRYKLLPEKMPSRYLMVNLAGYYLNLYDEDTLVLTSKVICGKPQTRTPLLNSGISELVTFPRWTVPASIIQKEILPAVKKNPGYLAKKDFSLVDARGEEVDPYTVDWSKYSKGIPYKVVQGSGDDNALGILKFNFPNKYAVYLHDTNQRYLFAKTTRSLSHGCVRVQEWGKLAYNIVRYDNKEFTDKPSPVEDSLTTWLSRKEKHSIPVRNRLPLYIRYFTCSGSNGKLSFYDDIYGEDKMLREKYFSGK